MLAQTAPTTTYCSVCHAVFVELPDLPGRHSPSGHDAPATLSQHPWLRDGLPVLNVARSSDFMMHGVHASIILDTFDCYAAQVLKVRVVLSLLELSSITVHPPV